MHAQVLLLITCMMLGFKSAFYTNNPGTYLHAACTLQVLHKSLSYLYQKPWIIRMRPISATVRCHYDQHRLHGHLGDTGHMGRPDPPPPSHPRPQPPPTTTTNPRWFVKPYWPGMRCLIRQSQTIYTADLTDLSAACTEFRNQ